MAIVMIATSMNAFVQVTNVPIATNVNASVKNKIINLKNKKVMTVILAGIIILIVGFFIAKVEPLMRKYKP